MTAHWLELTAADVPGHNDWLGAREAVLYSRMRFAKRRADWRLGRWTAKHAIADYLGVKAWAAIEILPAAGGAPEVFIANAPAPVTISISHRAGVAACAVASPGAVLGCDLEVVEPRSDAFAQDYFTAEEQALVAGASDRFRMLALLWSAKESVLKALRIGLRGDPRAISIRATDDGAAWRPLQAGYQGQVFAGWWGESGALLRTIVTL